MWVMCMLLDEQAEGNKHKGHSSCSFSAHPSCPNIRPVNKKPSTGEALTDLNKGITSTVAARNVRKSSPSGTKGSLVAEIFTLLRLDRLDRLYGCRCDRRYMVCACAATLRMETISTATRAGCRCADLRRKVGGPALKGSTFA